MTDSISANDFDPPLEGKQVEQVQEVINEALRRRIAEEKVYPYVEGDFLQLGPELFTGAEGTPDHGKLMWKGVLYTEPAAASVEEKKLSAYNSGELVEVIKDGEWFQGTINGIEKKLGMIYVHTRRGPVTIGTPRNIRPYTGQ
jgi:hypothetical protein